MEMAQGMKRGGMQTPECGAKRALTPACLPCDAGNAGRPRRVRAGQRMSLRV